MANLFHVKMGSSKTIRDFMKRFEAVILQLDTINTDTVMQVVKQVIQPNAKFFASLSL